MKKFQWTLICKYLCSTKSFVMAFWPQNMTWLLNTQMYRSCGHLHNIFHWLHIVQVTTDPTGLSGFLFQKRQAMKLRGMWESWSEGRGNRNEEGTLCKCIYEVFKETNCCYKYVIMWFLLIMHERHRFYTMDLLSEWICKIKCKIYMQNYNDWMPFFKV